MASVDAVRIEPGELGLSPGAPGTFAVTVYNSTDIIEGYSVSLIGLDPAWVAVDPAPLRLFPDNEGVATVTVVLPSGYPAGNHVIGVKVTADASGREWLGEVTLAVAPITAATLSVTPATVTGKSRARFTVAVQNHGNLPLTVALETTDPESAVTTEFVPPYLDVGAAQRATAEMTASGKRPWAGSPAPRLITVVGRGRTEPLEALVTFMQKAIVPSWMVTLLALLLVLIAWILALVFGVDQVLSANQTTTTTVVQPGLVSGRVSAVMAGSQEPLAGVVVEAFSPKDLMAPAGVAITTAASEDPAGLGGAYVVDDLEPGSYLLRFTSNEFGDMWYSAAGGAADSTGASIVTVSDAGTSDPADPGVTFNQSAAICGTVTYAATVPAAAAGSSSTTTTVASTSTTTAGSTTTTTVASSGTTAAVDCDNRPTATSTSSGSTTSTTRTAASGTSSTTTTTVAVEASASAGDAAASGCPVADFPPPFGPLGGVVVTIAPVADDGTVMADPTMPAVAGPVVTAADGTYVLGGLPSPATYQLTFSRIGAATQTMTVSVGNGRDALADATLVPGTNSISGTVSAPSDSTPACPPVVTLELVPTTPGVAAPTSVTVAVAADGSYSATGLEEGDYKLTISQEGFADDQTTVTLMAGVPAEDVAMTLAGAPAVIKGSIWAADMTALGGVTVTVTDQTDMVVTTTDDEAAIFVFEDLATPAMYTVTFEKEGFVTQVLAVDLQPGMTVDEEIVLAPVSATDLSAIFGAVTNKAGAKLTGVQVSATDGTTVYEVETTDDPAGAYEITNLPPGTYTITYTSGDQETTVLRQLATSERLEVNVVLDVDAPLTLDELRLGSDGLGVLTFGMPTSEVLEQLTLSFGAPTADDGQVVSTGQDGTCPGTTVHTVRYGFLKVVNTVANGVETFAGYRLDRSFDAAALTAHPTGGMLTISGVKLGTQVQDAAAIYAALDFEVAAQADGSHDFTLRRLSDNALLLHGPVSGPAATDTISGIYSRDACSQG